MISDLTKASASELIQNWEEEKREKQAAIFNDREAAMLLNELANESPTAFGTTVLSNAARHLIEQHL